VLLGEPSRTQGDINFALFGIPIRIHPFFWIIGLLLGMNNTVPGMLVWIAAFFLGILVHELGHALVMRAFGLHPWITLYGMGGMASYDPAEARHARADSTLRQIIISAAGPGAGFMLAAAVVAGILLSGHGFGEIVGNLQLTWFITDILFVTVVYGILNLLPIFPLDGGQISREILLKLMPRNGIHHSLMLSIVTAGSLALFGLLQGEIYLAFLFGYLAFSSYQALQYYNARRPW
jgi:stage IV sporulation protein FB